MTPRDRAGKLMDALAWRELTVERIEASITAAENEAYLAGRAAGLEEAARLVKSWALPHGSDGKYEHMADRILERITDPTRHIPLGDAFPNEKSKE